MAPRKRSRSTSVLCSISLRSLSPIASIAFASRVKRSVRFLFHLAANPNNARPHYIQNIPSCQWDRMPLLGMPSCYLIRQAEAGAIHTKIADAQTGTLLNEPNAGRANRRGADARVLVEQHQIVRCQRFRQHEIGAETCGKRIHEISEQRFG